jgi:hypothetical protein
LRITPGLLKHHYNQDNSILGVLLKNKWIIVEGVFKFFRSLHKKVFVGKSWTFWLWTFLFLSKNDFCDIIFFHVTEKKSGFLFDLFQSVFSVTSENIFSWIFYFFLKFGIF